MVLHAHFLDWILHPGPWSGPCGVGEQYRSEENQVLVIKVPPSLVEEIGDMSMSWKV